VLLQTLEEPLVIFQNHPKTQTSIPQFPRNKNTNIMKLQSKVLWSSFMNLKYFHIPKIAKTSIGISELLALHAWPHERCLAEPWPIPIDFPGTQNRQASRRACSQYLHFEIFTRQVGRAAVFIEKKLRGARSQYQKSFHHHAGIYLRQTIWTRVQSLRKRSRVHIRIHLQLHTTRPNQHRHKRVCTQGIPARLLIFGRYHGKETRGPWLRIRPPSQMHPSWPRSHHDISMAEPNRVRAGPLDSVKIPATEFWVAICEEELYIKTTNYNRLSDMTQKLFGVQESAIKCYNKRSLNFIGQNFQKIMPRIFLNLRNVQEEEVIDGNALSVFNSSSRCIETSLM
jgi:hypothetical protein